MTTSIREPQIFSRLRGATRVLIAGAGGGFDIFAGLPLALALRDAGKEIFLANLSFTTLGATNARMLTPHLFAVTPECEGEDGYFPERALAEWLEARGLPSTVYAFEKVGVKPLYAAYLALCQETKPDAIVLVDGGTDILMFGDEAGLGTPQEDMSSLAAVDALDVPLRFVACIGFGVDAYHGVCHAHFLENVATLERDGAYLGSFSVPRSSPEGAAFLDAVRHAQDRTPFRPSIVNGSIASAIAGEFGNAQFTDRTSSSELFINPLMGMYFTFDLPGLAKRSLYLDRLANTRTMYDITEQIQDFRREVRPRPRRPIPH
jgi:hypothetical protein